MRAPVAAVAAVAAVWLAVQPGTADMAAHAYRAWLWDTEGFTVWNNQWYGGHHVPGYSLLFPPLAGAVGAWVAVALAGTFAAVTTTALTGHRTAAWLVASGVAANVVVGRGPFVLGVGFGALALLMLARGRTAAAVLAALATAWSSPVAGLFLALALAAHAVGTGDTASDNTLRTVTSKPQFRAAAAALLAVLIAGALMLLPFPEGGAERFVASAFWPMLAVTLAAAALIDPRHRTLRLAAAGYAVLLVAAFVIETPVGQNATRLGALAGPAVLALAGRGPRAALLLTAAALVYLAWLPAVRAVDEQRGDPAREAAFPQPLIDFLATDAAPGDRVEIPLTKNHWEATHVAKRRAIARGWERQLDLRINGLFYDDPPLTAKRYEEWLRTERIRWVAVPARTPLDFSAEREADLIAARPPFLRLRRRTRDWTIYETAGVPASPITASTPSSLTVDRRAILGLRFTRYWRIAGGRGCVRRTRDGRVEVTGPVRLEARVTGPNCR